MIEAIAGEPMKAGDCVMVELINGQFVARKLSSAKPITRLEQLQREHARRAITIQLVDSNGDFISEDEEVKITLDPTKFSELTANSECDDEGPEKP